MTGPQTQHVDRCIYLVQHGEAEAKSSAPERPLTAAGTATVEKMATWAAKIGVKVDQIRHSGKLRAQQTGTILANRLEPREGVAEYPGLGPNDDVQPVADALDSCSYPVMVVGHLPFLSRLASLMLANDLQRELVRFRNAGLVGLVREAEGWKVSCVVPPEWVVEQLRADA